MKEKFKMKEVFLDPETKLNNIFLTPDALTNTKKLIVLVQGSGAVRCGQWARSLCFNESLHQGACNDYIEQAIKEGYGVIALNPNLNSTPKKEYIESDKVKYNWFDIEKPGRLKREFTNPIKNSESPIHHVVTAWNEYISKSKAKDIVFIAHSAGGWASCGLLRNKKEPFKRVRCIAFTDSVHSLNYDDESDLKKLLKEHSKNWVTSKEKLDTKLKFSQDQGCFCVSAGHTVHENTSSSCQSSVFKYLKEQIDEYNNDNN